MRDDYVEQLPDVDPEETTEWLDSLDSLVDAGGERRARFVLAKLTDRARALGVGTPLEVSTPYINTIPASAQEWFPGDVAIERRIRAYIRWNAAVMVVNANHRADGIGGHLATYASSAGLYELGFNHFFKGKAHGQAGDHVYFQGHAAPGIYSRAYLEGRFDETHLSNFRRELSGHGLTSYPHPWLMGDFWEFPTVSMGLGPINSIYHARFNRYLHHRRIDDTSNSRVWCFLGDGECDEPEALGSISLAGREHLDNLTWVVNCNLQRLDGPVRGNGKIIQELEAVFRGAGWNVIKVIWAEGWDALLAHDTDGVLLDKMNTTVDGEFQRYATESGAYIREHFFGPDPRLRALVSHLTDDELQKLPRGGHDYLKMYAAYKSATEHRGSPTVILAKTVKGWTLGSATEGRNASHQVKKLNHDQLVSLRTRLHLEDVIDETVLAKDDPPYYRPPAESDEYRYMTERRDLLGGSLPQRSTIIRKPLVLPPDDTLNEFDQGSKGAEVSTTMSFTRLLRTLARTEGLGPRVVPIIPDEARTFGMDALFREFGIYASEGQRYESVDARLLLSYTESQDGQLLEEGIPEAGSMASFTAAEAFQAIYRLHELAQLAKVQWERIDFLLLPTAPTIFTVAQLLADPIRYNSLLGIYTNFVNLLDCAAMAIPAGFCSSSHLPFGVSLIGPAFTDRALAYHADRLHRALKLPVANTGEFPAADAVLAPPSDGRLFIAVAGAHLSGMPLNPQLTSLGATLSRAALTAPGYRLYALANTVPAKPGLVRDPGFTGPGIAIEIWSLSQAAFGTFVASLPRPMCIGKIELAEGGEVPGFLCEPAALAGATDITHSGGWRAFCRDR